MSNLVKVKVKISLCLINLGPLHEDRCGSGDIVPLFLTSALNGGEWAAAFSLGAPLPALIS
jgi:hypothetical protein